jgi:hypothetical protein
VQYHHIGEFSAICLISILANEIFKECLRDGVFVLNAEKECIIQVTVAMVIMDLAVPFVVWLVSDAYAP